jgi:hypothetical protein
MISRKIYFRFNFFNFFQLNLYFQISSSATTLLKVAPVFHYIHLLQSNIFSPAFFWNIINRNLHIRFFVENENSEPRMFSFTKQLLNHQQSAKSMERPGFGWQMIIQHWSWQCYLEKNSKEQVFSEPLYS